MTTQWTCIQRFLTRSKSILTCEGNVHQRFLFELLHVQHLGLICWNIHLQKHRMHRTNPWIICLNPSPLSALSQPHLHLNQIKVFGTPVSSYTQKTCMSRKLRDLSKMYSLPSPYVDRRQTQADPSSSTEVQEMKLCSNYEWVWQHDTHLQTACS